MDNKEAILHVLKINYTRAILNITMRSIDSVKVSLKQNARCIKIKSHNKSFSLSPPAHTF